MLQTIYKESFKSTAIFSLEAKELNSIVFQCFHLAFNDHKDTSKCFNTLFRYLRFIPFSTEKLILSDCFEYLKTAKKTKKLLILIRKELEYLLMSDCIEADDLHLFVSFFDLMFISNVKSSLVTTLRNRKMLSRLVNLCALNSVWSLLALYFIANSYLFGWGGIMPHSILELAKQSCEKNTFSFDCSFKEKCK